MYPVYSLVLINMTAYGQVLGTALLPGALLFKTYYSMIRFGIRVMQNAVKPYIWWRHFSPPPSWSNIGAQTTKLEIPMHDMVL